MRTVCFQPSTEALITQILSSGLPNVGSVYVTAEELRELADALQSAKQLIVILDAKPRWRDVDDEKPMPEQRIEAMSHEPYERNEGRYNVDPWASDGNFSLWRPK